MKKTTIILIGVIVLIAIIAGTVLLFSNSKPKSNLPEIASEDDLLNLLESIEDKVYEAKNGEMPNMISAPVDLTDADSVKDFTGLENGENLEFLVVSQPSINAQAYSFVLGKVKEGVDANEIAKQMNEKINPRKWVCVSAEKVYSTSSGDVVCLVMSSEELAKPIYDEFKALAGGIGEEFVKTEEAVELPPDMY